MGAQLVLDYSADIRRLRRVGYGATWLKFSERCDCTRKSDGSSTAICVEAIFFRDASTAQRTNSASGDSCALRASVFTVHPENL